MLTAKNQKRIYIAWFPFSAPSESMANHVGARAYHIHYFKKRRMILAPLKYVFASLKTMRILYSEQPDIVFVMNPPIFAVLVVWLYCCLKNAKYVVDTHSGIFTARRWKFFLPLYRFLANRAIINMLHNLPLAQEVASWGASSIVLEPGPIQTFTDRHYPFRLGFNVVVISSYDCDEPVHEVLEAARQLPSVNFYITGSLLRAPRSISKNLPVNVVLTDFLSRADYLALLKGCDVAICLTKTNNTHQWGALEALEFERPIITSDWPVLRDYFSKGTVHIDNTAISMVNAVKRVQENHAVYLEEISTLRQERRTIWNKKLSKLQNVLSTVS